MNGNEFLIKNGTLVKYTGSSTCVVIPDSVTTIGEDSFKRCNHIRNISIPNSVKYIEAGAFYGCASLTDVVIPDSVVVIGDHAFSHCDFLTNVSISNHIKSIGYSSFRNCKCITSIILPNSLESIGSHAFGGCSRLREISIPESVTSIGESILCNCDSLMNIKIDVNNQHYKTIDGNIYSKDGTTMFQYAPGKRDSSFKIPDHVVNIDGAFFQCGFLEWISIPNSVKSMKYAFSHSQSLKTVLLPATLTCISQGAFAGCRSLKNIAIPDSVIRIERSAFYECLSLESVVVPNSVKSIGENAFYRCCNATIYIPDYVDCDYSAFNGCGGVDSNKHVSHTNKVNNMSNLNNTYVFISYSSKNKDYAEATLHLLKSEGIGTWMAPYDIPAGSKYAYVINDAIQKCSCVLLLLSEQSQGSEWVEKEVERAVSYKKTIISMHLDGSQLNSGFSFYLGNQQIVPVKTIDKNNANVQKVLNAIRFFVD